MNIIIKIVPHSDHLEDYPTVGGWVFDADGNLQVTVSDMGNWEYEAAVGLHEAVEALLCRKRNIAEESVWDFDREFEKKRIPGNVDEPGDEPDAPYRDEHCIATGIEKVFIAALGISWKKYDETVQAL